MTPTEGTRELVERVRWLVADLEEAMVQLTARLNAAETQRDDALRDLVRMRNHYGFDEHGEWVKGS